MKRLRSLLFIPVAILTAALSINAQTSQGRILGTVTDSAEAAGFKKTRSTPGTARSVTRGARRPEASGRERSTRRWR